MENFPILLKRGGEMYARGEPFAVVTVIRALAPTSVRSGDKALVCADGSIHGWIGGGCAQPAVIRTVKQALTDGQPRSIRITPEKNGEEIIADVIEFGMPCSSGGSIELFIDPVLQQQELVVLGDSPVADALLRIAPNVGFRATWLADAATAAPGIRLVPLGNAAAISAGAFVVVATQGRQDLPLLKLALELRARHVAFVASRRKGDVLKEALVEAGCDRARVDAIEAPAGYPINAQTPEEIALSIVSALVTRRRATPLAQPAAAPVELKRPVAVPVTGDSCCGGGSALPAITPVTAIDKGSCCS